MTHCGGSEPLTAFEVGIDSPQDLSGSWRELTPEQFDCRRLSDLVCSVTEPPHGRVAVRQGSAAGFVDTRRAGEVTLDCDETCSVAVTVHADDGCAAGGAVEVYLPAPGPPVVASSWQRDQVTVVDGVPCAVDMLVVKGGRCGARRQWLATGLDGAYELWLAAPRPVTLRVRHADTGEPIAGACTSSEVPFEHDCTGADGLVTVDGRDLRGSVVRAGGYAPHDLQTSYADKTGYLEVELWPTRPLEVECRDGDQPCPEGTWVALHGASETYALYRPCARRGPGRYACDAIEGDNVSATYDGRDSFRVPVEGDFTRIELAPAASEGCLSFATGHAGSCTVDWGGGPRAGGWTSGKTTVSESGRFAAQLEPGASLELVLRCPDGIWTGDVRLGEPGSGAQCIDLALDDYGTICGPPSVLCSAKYARLVGKNYSAGSWRGCSGGLLPGRWEVECADGYAGTVTVFPGESTLVDP